LSGLALTAPGTVVADTSVGRVDSAPKEDTEMKTTRWLIGIGALVVALGTGWVYERTHGAIYAYDGSSGVVNAPATLQSLDPPVVDWYQEHDRVDLLLIQG
jgi:hypothetical protein